MTEERRRPTKAAEWVTFGVAATWTFSAVSSPRFSTTTGTK